jgi:hypothetical protein
MRAARASVAALAGAGTLLLAHGQTVPAASATEDAPGSALRFSGFATLGLTHHDNADAGVITAFSQRAPADKGWSANLDSVLGVQADARLAESTSLTVQGVARAGDEGQPRLRMAYARQKLGQDTAVRLGRIRSPLFLDSDVSEIGFAYLSTRPALPLYGVAANNVPHLDGVDLQWRHAFDPAALMVQAFVGQSAYKHVFYNLDPQERAQAKLDGMRGLALSVALPEVTVRASRTWIRSFTMRSAQIDQLDAGLAQLAGGLNLAASNPFLPAPFAAGLAAKAQAVADLSHPFDARPIYTSLGADATLGDWRITGEEATFDSRSAMVGKYRGWSFTLGYTWGSFTPYLTGSSNQRSTPPLDTSALAATGLDPALDGGLAQMQGALTQAGAFTDLSARSAGLGVRWDWRDDRVVKFQFDRLSSRSAAAPGVFAVRQLPIDPVTHLFSLTLDFVF